MLQPTTISRTGAETSHAQKDVSIFRQRYGRSFFDGEDYRTFLKLDDVAPQIEEEVLRRAMQKACSPFSFYLTKEINFEFLEDRIKSYGGKIHIAGNGHCSFLRDEIQRPVLEGWYVLNSGSMHMGKSFAEHTAIASAEGGGVIPDAFAAMFVSFLFYLKNNSPLLRKGVVRTSTVASLPSSGEKLEIGIGLQDGCIRVLPFMENSRQGMIMITFKKIFD